MIHKLAKLVFAVIIVFGFARLNTPTVAASTGCDALDGFSQTFGGGVVNNFGPYDLEAGERVRVVVSNIAGPVGAVVNIAATVGGLPIGGSVLAQPGDIVITIPADLTVSFAVSGTFNSVTVAVSCSTPSEGELPGPAEPPDSRVNFGFGDTDVVLFPATGELGIFVYGVDEDGEGYFVFSITEADVAAYLDNPPAENTLIKQSADGKFSLYVLTTGEFQLNIGPDEEGKTLVIIFDGLSPDNIYGYVLEA